MNKFSLMPFWFWNGDMDDNEIVRQIKLMKSQKIEEFLICARQGLSIPYLSNEWFNKVSVAIEEAKKNNMAVWLYDEYPYPSGISGGEVINGHAEYEVRIMKQIVINAKRNEITDECFDWGEVLSAKAYPLHNGEPVWNEGIDVKEYIGNSQIQQVFLESTLVKYNSKRIFTENISNRLYFKADNKDYVIYIFVSKKLTNFKYFDSFVDPLNENAIDRFIQTTHEKYKKYFADEFGKTIKGIFTDEIAPFGDKLIWSNVLPEIFKNKNGYDIKENLIHITEYIDEKTPKIRYDYYNTITEIFIENYDKKIKKWCNDNNLLYVGEKPILRSEQLQYFDIPGIDAGHQKAGDLPNLVDKCYRHSAKIVSSAAHFYNKEFCLCECFHSIGWSISIQDMKWIFDWLSIMGIDMFVLHAFYYSSDALLKHDAPPSMFFQMPAYRHTNILSDYMKNLHTLLKGASRNVDVLLIDPITSVWTNMSKENEILNNFKQLQEQLIKNGIDYYVIDQRLLEKAEIIDNEICINGEKFKHIVLPYMTNVEAQALDVIANFNNTLFLGHTPFEKIQDICLKSFFKDIKDENVFTSLDLLIKYLKTTIINDIEIIKDDNVIFASYKKDDKYILFIMNTENKKSTVKIKSNFENEFYSINLENNNIEENTINNYIENDLRYAQLELCELQAVVLTNDDKKLIPKINNKAKIILNTKEKWEFKLCGMNSLRLSKWELSLNDLETKLVDSMPILNQIGKGNFLYPAKKPNRFYDTKQLSFDGADAKYKLSFKIKSMPKKPIYIVMEPNSICGEWEGYINGCKIILDNFENKPIYMNTNLCYDISNIVKTGSNDIEIFVKAVETYDGIINPIYIFGEFSVLECDTSTNGYCISDIIEKGNFCDYKDCGIPFYAGDIDFIKTINNDKNESIVIALDENISYPVELFVDNISLGTRCWAPYEWHVSKTMGSECKLTLRVTNDLLGLFEGEYIERGTNLRITY